MTSRRNTAVPVGGIKDKFRNKICIGLRLEGVIHAPAGRDGLRRYMDD